MSRLAHAFIRECSSPKCAFRFPDLDIEKESISCPHCGAPANISHILDLKTDVRPASNQAYKYELVCILDNIRSVYNVGSIFRTMQGFGITDAFLCGITPNPDHQQFAKTALGADQDVNWQVIKNTVYLCESLKAKGTKLIALESCASAIPINRFDFSAIRGKVGIIIGNEITGIDPAVLNICDHILAVPIIGRNKSFNVTVAFGIGLYSCLFAGTAF